MQSDRRKYIRFEVPLDVIFKPSRDAVPYSTGITRNFSRHGLCIETTSLDMELNTNLNLMVKHPGKDIFVAATGDMVWKQHVGGKWLAGVNIVKMDKEAKSEILDYAYDVWLEKNINFNSA
ncbi:MAG: PilZ domain-containing protein [Nitrospiraceae bacterium]|nr:MAG: PilZ domain-containing protein [Nitrospiraceae bacterium]